jgi:hypothetical protein
MSEPTHSQIAFVFRYFAERSFGRNQQGNYRSVALEATTTFDEGTDFWTSAEHFLPFLLVEFGAEGNGVDRGRPVA